MRRFLLLFTAAAALATPAPAMATGALDQSQDGGVAGSNMVWGSVRAAQSFTAGISGDLDQVDLLLARSGSPGDLAVEIQTMAGGVPSGTVLASETVPAASVTSSYTWISVPLSPVAPSSAGVQYAIVLSAPSSIIAIDRYDWAVTGGDPYAAGTQLSSLDGGANWIAGDPNNDSNFKTYVGDSTAPDTTIVSGPAGGTYDPTATFSFSSSEAGSSFECKLDAGAYAACGSPNTTPYLTDGLHTFSVRATDLAGNQDSTPASRTIFVRTASVRISGTTLLVTAAVGAKDNLAITRPSASTLRVTDFPSGAYTGSGVRAGPGCTQSGDSRVNCGAAGITLMQVASGDQTDQVVVSTRIRSSVDGGTAGDVLTGGLGNDTLTGGAGADVMKGMGGNDQLFDRDFTSDPTINCDGGPEPGAVDKAYLDPLPRDPSPAGCETVVRQYPYLALGDSLSVGTGASPAANSFVRRLYSGYQTSLGASPLLNRAQSGATSTSLKDGGQLSRAIADLNAPSDTKALTIGIGGNDGLSGPCAGHWHQPSVCPFRANFEDILGILRAALQTDLGAETFTTMAYYNPSSGTGGGLETSRRRMLLGNNLVVGCADTGANLGLNDVIYQEAGQLGVPVADPYPAFRQHGQAYIASDGLHPNNAGHAAIAEAFRNPSRRCG